MDSRDKLSVVAQLEALASRVEALEKDSHPSVPGLALAEDVEKELKKMNKRLNRLEGFAFGESKADA